MNVKDMKEFISDLPDDTKLYIAVGEVTCDGKQMCVFDAIRHGFVLGLKNDEKTKIGLFIHNEEKYDNFIERNDLLKNMKHPHWD